MKKHVFKVRFRDKKSPVVLKFKQLTFIALIVTMAGCTADMLMQNPSPPVVGEAVVAGTLANGQINEASGLAPSRIS